MQKAVLVGEIWTISMTENMARSVALSNWMRVGEWVQKAVWVGEIWTISMTKKHGEKLSFIGSDKRCGKRA